MTNEQKLALAADRAARLEASPKNIKCGGVLRKAKRTVRNLSKAVNA
jgi:hypothetical protein